MPEMWLGAPSVSLAARYYNGPIIRNLGNNEVMSPGLRQYQFDDVTVQPGAFRVAKSGQPLALEPTAINAQHAEPFFGWGTGSNVVPYLNQTHRASCFILVPIRIPRFLAIVMMADCRLSHAIGSGSGIRATDSGRRSKAFRIGSYSDPLG